MTSPFLKILPSTLPDYLPARMVNEFVYCPRLFYYEWVDGVFRESVDTVEGKIQHQRVDKRATEMPAPVMAMMRRTRPSLMAFATDCRFSGGCRTGGEAGSSSGGIGSTPVSRSVRR